MEHEVKSHAVKAYKVWKNPHVAFWHKVKEIAIEVGIIVFAVSLSIWLHSWSEHRHEQKQVNTFLLGLRKDLQADVSDAKELIEYYNGFTKLYSYLSSLNEHKQPDIDSLKLAIAHINENGYLRPHKTRFNGFSSTGKIMNIENDSLVQNILQYYQETIPELQSSEEGWMSNNNSLNDYIVNSGINRDDPIGHYKILTSPKGKVLTKQLIPWQQIFDRYYNLIDKGNSIIASIDKMYPEIKQETTHNKKP